MAKTQFAIIMFVATRTATERARQREHAEAEIVKELNLTVSRWLTVRD